MKFKSTYDTMVFLVSIIAIGITLYLLIVDVGSFVRFDSNIFSAKFLSHSYLSLLLVCVIVISYLLSVKSYEVTTGNIIIKKNLGVKQIPFSEIESVERIIYLDAYIRLFGIGGLFGYSGVFLSTSSKIIYLFTSHKGNLIRINRKEKKAVYISPDNSKDFIEFCKKMGLKEITA